MSVRASNELLQLGYPVLALATERRRLYRADGDRHGRRGRDCRLVRDCGDPLRYSNFKNKEDLFLALMDQRTEEQIAAVQTTLEEAASLTSDERTTRFTDLTARAAVG